MSLSPAYVFFINICIIPIEFTVLLITYQSIFQNIFSELIEIYFDKKMPWNFLQSSMELFKQHLATPVAPLSSMELKQQNLRVRPWNSM